MRVPDHHANGRSSHSQSMTDDITLARIRDRVVAKIAEQGTTGVNNALPFLTLTYAQSIDGSIAARRGGKFQCAATRSAGVLIS